MAAYPVPLARTATGRYLARRRAKRDRDELYVIWSVARAEANIAYDAWCRPGRRRLRVVPRRRGPGRRGKDGRQALLDRVLDRRSPRRASVRHHVEDRRERLLGHDRHVGPRPDDRRLDEEPRPIEPPPSADDLAALARGRRRAPTSSPVTASSLISGPIRTPSSQGSPIRRLR